ncbi:hypothetical protein [Paenibacillus harenae]|uniref:hypothetical protein n=1 Tax=Paenibacillus harenae TaxID=306543 RepID=UPI0003F4F038|nr:hypothetical protein [Paenibacillus harenae]
MFGQERLNAHNIVKYGLTKEFFERFRTLKYNGIELPPTMMRSFHMFIMPYVNRHMTNRSYVSAMRRKHRLATMRNVQSALFRKPKVTTNLGKVSSRTTILLPAKLVSFALEKLLRYKVVIIVSDANDRKALFGKRLPSNFKIYNYSQAIRRVQVPVKIRDNLKKYISRYMKLNRRHPVFGKSRFGSWFYRQSLSSIKANRVLDHLIRRYPIGIVIDHIEISNPGTTLVLLANKYNLPFINVPQLLIADRSLIPARASHYVVWGKSYKKWMTRRGIAPGKIIIGGNIRFKSGMRKVKMSRPAFLKQYRIPPNHIVVTYTSQPFDRRVNATVLRWIRQTSRLPIPVIFIIKPHPEDSFNYSRYIRENQKIRLLPGNNGLNNVLQNTDLVMTISSNTAIEAAMFKKGIIVLQPTIPYDYDHHNNDFNAHLVHAAAGMVAYNHGDLARHLKSYCVSKQSRIRTAVRSNAFLKQTLNTSVNPSVVLLKVVRKLLKRKRLYRGR